MNSHSNSKQYLCPLCNSLAIHFYNHIKSVFYRCGGCDAIFVPVPFLLNRKDEELRYLGHNNNINDPGHRKFIQPLIDAVVSNFSKSALGLDFGAGYSPIASAMLAEMGYSTDLYDPFFHPNTQVFDKKYDYILSSEVIEHFYYPKMEFSRLREMLHTGGKLFCQTHLYSDDIVFRSWYYKNDPTHVFIYTPQTLQWIQENLGFSDLSISGRIIVFSKH